METFPVFPSLKHGNTKHAEKIFENSIYNILYIIYRLMKQVTKNGVFPVSAEETVGNVSGVSSVETEKQLLSCCPDVS